VERRILAHYEFVAERTFELTRRAADGVDVTAQARQLARHHVRELRHFQHERLIHLLVTLFFGALTLVCLAATLVVAGIEERWPGVGLAAVTLVVLTIEAFYLRHYYRLENGVQRLYELDRPLADLAAGRR
jgi:hypothetical protein